MKQGEILNELEKLFFSKLDSKTGWGKIEIKKLYLECQIEVMKNLINKLEATGKSLE